MYVVIRTFVDLQDWQVVGGIRSYHRYIPGDVYPREGLTPTPERIRSLLTADNAQHVPLIAVPVPPEEEAKPEPVLTQEVPEKPAAKPKRTSRKKPAAKKEKS